MLGDLYDTYGDHHVAEMIAFAKAAIADERFTVLLGNHDCHYYFPSVGFACSGFTRSTKEAVQAQVTPDEIRKLRIWTTVGPYAVSHAGFCEDTLHLMKEEMHKEAIEQALAGTRVHPLFQAGRARGGPARVGGPVWLDWNYEFEHIDDLPQIVGHTVGKEVRREGSNRRHSVEAGVEFDSYCLDTASRHAAWVDEETGEVSIIDVKL